MSSTAARSSAQYNSDYDVEPRGSGWLGYAAIMLGLAGTWNVIDGILAISQSKVYVLGAKYVFSDLKTWGWIVLVLGVVELCAAFAVLGGSQMARWFGIGAAGLNSIGQLMFVQAAPFWAISMFAADMLIIYALAVYGGQEVEI